MMKTTAGASQRKPMKMSKPGDLWNRAKAKLKTIASIPAGMRSGKKMVASATKNAQARVYKNANPATRMMGKIIEKGVKPRDARKTSYSDALKALKK